MSVKDAFGKAARLGQDVAFIDDPWDTGPVLERGKIIDIVSGQVLVVMTEESLQFNIKTGQHDIPLTKERKQWVKSSRFIIT